jgi:hypothetical protein
MRPRLDALDPVRREFVVAAYRFGHSMVRTGYRLRGLGPGGNGTSCSYVPPAGTLAHIVALSQALHEELKSHGLRIQALCPGVVATEFHERQGLDLSRVPRMSADDVVTASLRALAVGEVVCAPGVESSELLDAVFKADLAAFAAQAPQLAGRYRMP